MSRSRLALTLWFCLVSWCPVAAQTGTAVVAGTVVGADGVSLAGVAVTATNRDTGLRRMASTTADGHYFFPNLPIEGAYDIRFAAQGFAAALVEGIRLSASGLAGLDVMLQVAVAESVTVAAPRAPLDRPRAVVQQAIEDNLLRALPLFGRDVLHVTALAAGFNGHPDYPNAQGQPYWANNVLVDGASHFSKWRGASRSMYSGYSLESVREVQVLTNLFSAEFGEALASVTNVVTRAGTNTWHGSALLFVRDDALDAVPAFASRTPPAGAQQAGGSFGGPIVRDRTHLWASLEMHRTRDRNIVLSPAASGALVPDDQDERLVFARVDHQQSSRQLLTARYNGQLFDWHHEPGGLTLPGSGTHYRTDVHTLNVSDAIQVSDRLLHEMRIQFARYVDVRTDLRPAVYVSRAGYSIEGGLLGAAGFGANPEDTWEAADTWSLWRAGHVLRAGGGARYVRSHDTALGYGRGAYFFGGAPDQFPQPFLYAQGIASTPAAAESDPRSLSVSGFVQDDWAARPGLTLNLGLRYDIERISHIRGFTVPVDADNLQPRLGVVWDPGHNARTVVRGGIGLFTQQHLLFTLDRVALEGFDGARTLFLGSDSRLIPAYPATLSPALLQGTAAPPGDLVRVGASYRNPYSLQAALGVQRLLLGTIVGADYVRLDGHDLTSLVDLNAPVSNVKPAQRSVVAADATRPSLPLPGAYRKWITIGNDGRSWYRALQLKASRVTGPWQTVASYTWARADDMANGELPEDSRDLAADKARAATDVRHALAFGSTWNVPLRGRLLGGWSVSAVGLFRSNRPYTVSWGDDRNGTTQGDARPGARNTGRTGPYRTVDLALARRLSLAGATLEGRLEAFNLFNAVNYDRYVGELLSPFYGRPVSAFPQRRLQLAAVVRF